MSALRLLTVKTAAAALGVPAATVYRLVADRELAHVRLGTGAQARIYLREVDLAAYLDARRIPAFHERPLPPVLPIPASARRFS